MRRIARTVILMFACCNTALYAHAQVISRSSDTTKKTQPAVEYVKPKGPKAITHEMSVGVRLNSNGWSAYTDIGHVKAKDQKHSDMFYDVGFWQIELTEKKNPREEKITSDNPSAS